MTKQMVMDLFEVTRAEYLEKARIWADRIARHNGTVTIDEVREYCPPPEDVDPRLMGAVLSTKEFRCIGYRKSTRSKCHHRPIGIFELV